MKKTILTCLLLIGGILAMHINAQTKVSLGAKGSGVFTNLKMANTRDKKNSFDPGFSVSTFVSIELTENLVLQPELVFSYTEGRIRFGYDRLKYKYSTVEMPLYVLGQFEVGKDKIFFGAGPIIGHGFDTDDLLTDMQDYPYYNDYWDDTVRLGLNHWYYGGGMIVGYEHQSGMVIYAGYQKTLSFESQVKRKTNIETHSISLGVGYKF